MANKVETYIWPEPNYTDKIHKELFDVMKLQSYLRFNVQQMLEVLTKRLKWFTLDTDQRKTWARKIVKNGFQKYEQAGLVKETIDVILHEKGYIITSGANEQSETFQSITPEDEVAKTPEAMKRVLNRSVNRKEIKRLNNQY